MRSMQGHRNSCRRDSKPQNSPNLCSSFLRGVAWANALREEEPKKSTLYVCLSTFHTKKRINGFPVALWRSENSTAKCTFFSKRSLCRCLSLECNGENKDIFQVWETFPWRGRKFIFGGTMPSDFGGRNLKVSCFVNTCWCPVTLVISAQWMCVYYRYLMILLSFFVKRKFFFGPSCPPSLTVYG